MKKLIIIEDNWMMAHLIDDVATLLTIEVVGIATTWNEVSELLAFQKPDFAILDININGAIDGLEVARRLKEKNIPFLFLTAYKDIETIKEAAQLSPLSYLIKPISPENLMAAFLLIITKIEQKIPIQDAFEYLVHEDGFIYKKNIQLDLSKAERRILTLLIKNMGYYVGYDTLLHNEISNTNSLRNIITTLRKKCPDLVIKNIKDIGYIMHKSDSQLL